MPDKEIRAASLEYHRQSPAGQDLDPPTKQLTNQRDLALAYTPGVAAACDEIVRDPAEARNLTARGNLVGVVTNGTAVLGLGADRPARREAGDGRQGGAVQEVRRHRLLRHRDRRARPGQAGRHHRRARADVRRHQPRGHQGARVLLRRAQAARAHEDPGVPRRPARHGDHRRRGDHQRPARRRQGPRTRSSSSARARAPRRSRASTCSCSLGIPRENIWVADIAGVVYAGPHARRWTTTRRATRSRPTRASSPTSSPGADIFLGLSAAQGAEARVAREDGATSR